MAEYRGQQYIPQKSLINEEDEKIEKQDDMLNHSGLATGCIRGKGKQTVRGTTRNPDEHWSFQYINGSAKSVPTLELPLS